VSPPFQDSIISLHELQDISIRSALVSCLHQSAYLQRTFSISEHKPQRFARRVIRGHLITEIELIGKGFTGAHAGQPEEHFVVKMPNMHKTRKYLFQNIKPGDLLLYCT